MGEAVGFTSISLMGVYLGKQSSNLLRRGAMESQEREHLPCAVWPWCRMSCIERRRKLNVIKISPALEVYCFYVSLEISVSYKIYML